MIIIIVIIIIMIIIITTPAKNSDDNNNDYYNNNNVNNNNNNNICICNTFSMHWKTFHHVKLYVLLLKVDTYVQLQFPEVLQDRDWQESADAWIRRLQPYTMASQSTVIHPMNFRMHIKTLLNPFTTASCLTF